MNGENRFKVIQFLDHVISDTDVVVDNKPRAFKKHYIVNKKRDKKYLIFFRSPKTL